MMWKIVEQVNKWSKASVIYIYIYKEREREREREKEINPLQL